MENCNLFIIACGIFNLSFALFHILFWKLFAWDIQLKKINMANRGIMQMLNVQLIFCFLASAIICFVLPTELLTTRVGKYFLGSWAIFWAIRSVQQFIFLRINHKLVHLLTLIFLLGTTLFGFVFIKCR